MPAFTNHILEADLDDYARGVLDEAGQAAVETHLLVCEHCCEQLRAIDLLIEALALESGTGHPVDEDSPNVASEPE